VCLKFIHNDYKIITNNFIIIIFTEFLKYTHLLKFVPFLNHSKYQHSKIYKKNKSESFVENNLFKRRMNDRYQLRNLV
jgi:hypothetical protein